MAQRLEALRTCIRDEASLPQKLQELVCSVNAISVQQAITSDRLQGRVTATMRFLVGGATLIEARLAA